jgi:hypothetical protein
MFIIIKDRLSSKEYNVYAETAEDFFKVLFEANKLDHQSLANVAVWFDKVKESSKEVMIDSRFIQTLRVIPKLTVQVVCPTCNQLYYK